MNRTLILAAVVIVLVGAGGVFATGAVDEIFADAEDDIAADEVTLQPEPTPEGDVYAEIDDGELSVEIDNLNQLADTRVENVFNATYNGDQEARLHVEHDADDVEIFDMDTGAAVESADDAVILTPDDDVRRFGVDVQAGEDAESVLLEEVTYNVRAVNPAFEIVELTTDEDTVTAGDTVTVEATVTNDGSAFVRELALTTDTQDAVVATREVSIDEGQTRTIEFEYRTSANDVDAVAFGLDVIDDAIAADDDDAPVVDVEEPAAEFDVELDDVADSVTAGDELTVTADVENVGDEADTETVALLVNGSEATSVETTLDAGEEATVELTHVPTATDADAGAIEVEVQTPTDATDEELVAVEEPTEFEVDAVDIDDTEPVVGDELEVEATIENTGDEAGVARTWIEVGGTRVDFRTEEIAGEDDVDVTFTVDADAPGTEAIGVFTEDDEEIEGIDVRRPADIGIADVDADDTVADDEEIDVDVTLENVGGAEDDVDVTIDANGETVTETVTVAGGETEEAELSVGPFDPGPVEIVASAAGEEERVSTEVLAPAAFEVAIADVPDPALDDEDLEVDVGIVNVGDETGEETVELIVDGESVDEEDIEIDGGEAAEETLELDASEVETGDLDVDVVGTDDEDAATVDVIEAPDDPLFRIEDPELADSELVQGADEVISGTDELDIEFTVRNIGEEEDTQDVELIVDGETVATEEAVTLDGDGTADIEFTVDADELPLGEQPLKLRTDDVTRESAVLVREPFAPLFAFDDPEDVVDINTLEDGEDVSIEVANTGELDAETTVELTAQTARGEFTTAVAETVEIDATDTAEVPLEVDLDAETLRAGDFSGTLTVRITNDDARDQRLGTGVDLDFGTLEATVDDAAEGDTVRVGENALRGAPATIEDDGLTLEGVPGVLTPDVEDETAVEIDADEVVLSELTLRADEADDATAIEVTEDATGVEMTELTIAGDDWTHAIQTAGADTTIQFTTITGVEHGVVATGEDLRIADSELRDTTNATDLVGDAADAELRNTDLIANDRGIFATAGAHVLEASNVERNEAAIETVGTEAEVFVDAPDNWWGSAAGPVFGEDLLSNVGIPTVQTEPYEIAEFTLDDPLPPTAEETLAVEAAVTNEGGSSGTTNRQPVELVVDGEVVDTELLELDADETATVSLTHDPAELGPVDAVVRTEDDSVAQTVTIEAEEEEEEEEPDVVDPVPVAPSPTPEPVSPREIVDLPPDVDPIRAERRGLLSDEDLGVSQVAFSEVTTIDRITFDEPGVTGDIGAVSLDTEPNRTGPSPGRSAVVTQLDVPDALADEDAILSKQVSLERVDEIDADVEDLRINRYDPDEQRWVGLETTVTEETDTDVLLRAQTPGFSFFSVSAVSEPEAAFDVDPAEAVVEEEVTLDASAASDRYGELVSYEWTVNGETFAGETATVTFEEADDYEVELTVENDAGETDTTTETVTVADQFAVTVSADETVTAGEDITIEAVVENTGEAAGTETVTVVLETPEDTTTVTTREIELAAGETTTITETVTAPDETTETTVDVVATVGAAEDTATVTVVPPDDAIPGFGVVVAVLALLGVAALYGRRR